MLERGQHARLVWFGAERRNAGKLRLAQRFQLRLLGVNLALIAAELQVHRARRARHRDPERLPQHVGKPCHIVHGGVEFCHRLEGGHVVHLLIDLAEFGPRLPPAGHGDDRRMGEPGIAQAGGEVERADHLRHADAGLAGGAGIAVGHVGGGFLAMYMQPLDVGAALHLGKAAAQHGRDVEHMGDAVALEHVRQAFGAEHFFAIVSEHDGPCVLSGEGGW